MLTKDVPSLVGQRFARLVVTRHKVKDGRRTAVVYCDCDCGTKGFVVNQSQLKSKNTKSCGCIQKLSRAEQREIAKQYGTRSPQAPKLKDRDWDRGALVNGKWMTPEQIAAKEAEDKRLVEADERRRRIMEELDQFD